MKKNGFTLVELLAVIAILAILVIIAMPNVLDMFNKAKQDAFETEVRSHIKVVNSEFVTSGNLVYSNVVAGAAKLPMDGEKLDYYIELDSRGNIKTLNVTNGDYKVSVTGTSANPIKVEQIGDTIKSEVAKSGEEFAMSSDGSISGNSQGGSNTTEYVLKGTWVVNNNLTFLDDNIEIEQDVNYTILNYYGSHELDRSYFIVNNKEKIVTTGGGGSPVLYALEGGDILDFGATPQEVSKEFYDWFITTAKKQ